MDTDNFWISVRLRGASELPEAERGFFPIKAFDVNDALHTFMDSKSFTHGVQYIVRVCTEGEPGWRDFKVKSVWEFSPA